MKANHTYSILFAAHFIALSGFRLKINPSASILSPVFTLRFQQAFVHVSLKRQRSFFLLLCFYKKRRQRSISSNRKPVLFNTEDSHSIFRPVLCSKYRNDVWGLLRFTVTYVYAEVVSPHCTRHHLQLRSICARIYKAVGWGSHYKTVLETKSRDS